MDIKKEFDENQTVLLIMPSVDYNDTIIDTMKQLSGSSVCYVTMNKTYDSLKASFQKNNINTENIVFVDAISKTIKNVPDEAAGCYFCSSPGALTEISLVITKFIRHKFDYIIFDSLTNLLIYQKRAPVSKFVSSLINKIKASDTKAVFYALSVQEQESLIQQSGMFVDKVVEIGKK